MARHAVGVVTLRTLGPSFPVGTIVVNVAGSLAMGLLIGFLVTRGETSNDLRLLLATGFLGGFTTFSAFSLDFAALWSRGETVMAFTYAGATVVLALIAVFLGLWIMRQAGASWL